LNLSHPKTIASNESSEYQAKAANILQEIQSLFIAFVRRVGDLRPEDWTAIATVAIALFTVALVFVTNRQARLTRASIELGNKEFIATHRPRLVLRFTQSDPIRPNEKPGAQLIVDNAGSAKAYVIAKAGDIGQKRGAEWIPPWVFPSGVSLPEEKILKPGERRVFLVRATSPLSEGDIAEIEAGRNKLMLVGAFTYRDDNNVIRYTGFYREFDWNKREFHKITPTPDREYES